jgi:TadE-like protein
MKPQVALPRRVRSAAGTSLIEFALVLPLVLVTALGVIETSYALLDDHVVTKTSREGSNLISRDTTLQDAVTAMRQMANMPVNFEDGSSKMILSVLKKGGVVGSTNYDKAILYQRVSYGAYAGQSLYQPSGGSFGGAPDYRALNPDTDGSLQLTNVPVGLLSGPGSLVYVTEIFSRHQRLTPLDQFGIAFPTTLSSIAYF